MCCIALIGVIPHIALVVLRLRAFKVLEIELDKAISLLLTLILILIQAVVAMVAWGIASISASEANRMVLNNIVVNMVFCVVIGIFLMCVHALWGDTEKIAETPTA